ncbi:hypothetical protein C8R43DRAFT_1113747 [Mycena crocata]|nr:hypothetical protein C8R43DRAFT_1113747 [Mycena crocata]
MPFQTSGSQKFGTEILDNFENCCNFNRRIDSDSTTAGYDESAACKRIRAVLEASPHLVYIRRLRIALGHGTLAALSTLTFPNLREVFSHQRAGEAAVHDDAIELAAKIRVGLISTTFSALHDLRRLFRCCSPTVTSLNLSYIKFGDAQKPKPTVATADSPRPKVKKLRVWKTAAIGWEIDWLLDAASPFHVSGLVDLDYGASLCLIMCKMLEQNRRYLRRLSVDAQYAVNKRYTKTLHPDLLARLPALTHLTLVCNGHRLADPKTLLAIPPINPLDSLSLALKRVVQFFGRPDPSRHTINCGRNTSPQIQPFHRLGGHIRALDVYFGSFPPVSFQISVPSNAFVAKFVPFHCERQDTQHYTNDDRDTMCVRVGQTMFSARLGVNSSGEGGNMARIRDVGETVSGGRDDEEI